MANTDNTLISKYNVPGPRYTSYPTVPYWQDNDLKAGDWLSRLTKRYQDTNSKSGISLYIHLPFCESLCTFCGCNKRITINHGVESPYIQTVLNEWDLYLEKLGEKPMLRELHLGGGTPTFFSADNLRFLLESIYKKCDLHPDFELSFEAHPNVTSYEQMQVLYELGSRRISLGVQDFDPAVQQIINRVQPYETVLKVTEGARKIGYSSINFDIIYGLPLQKMSSIVDTITKVKQLMPERIAFYSYAHVPWVSPGQRRYTEEDLPLGSEKRDLYEKGREMLEAAGYIEIGMDHFSLPQDSLYKALKKGTLHRNFMGYTHQYTEVSIGLGVSSISDSWDAFAQNIKGFEEYTAMVNEIKEIPVFRGHLLNEEDLFIRKHILNLMCQLETSWGESEDNHPLILSAINHLTEMFEDGLVVLENRTLRVTESGRPFVRNACMAFDNRMWAKKPETQLFSQVI
ncbi:MAG: oxygen-independent coproporphyrinogen III oxidase [Chitinophagaceae bacterium]|nr:MAG: oxygen-independent coproporphyrinogen III oxidase [Chitinophagaceae bacterium]